MSFLVLWRFFRRQQPGTHRSALYVRSPPTHTLPHDQQGASATQISAELTLNWIVLETPRVGTPPLEM